MPGTRIARYSSDLWPFIIELRSIWTGQSPVPTQDPPDNLLNSRSFTALRMTPASQTSCKARLFRTGLADLLLETLASIANTLVFVRVWRTQGTHFGRDLPDLLTIDASDAELGLLGIDRDFDAGGQRILDRVGIP